MDKGDGEYPPHSRRRRGRLGRDGRIVPGLMAVTSHNAGALGAVSYTAATIG